MVSPVRGDYRRCQAETPLIVLCRLPGPALLDVDFGPVTKLQYNKLGPTDDVFVVTKGGLGTIGLASAVQNRNIITFTFSQPVCAADTSGPGQTTFFFGLASIHTAKAIVATVEVPGLFPGVDVKARAPNH
jgi:hypothetical protein